MRLARCTCGGLDCCLNEVRSWRPEQSEEDMHPHHVDNVRVSMKSGLGDRNN